MNKRIAILVFASTCTLAITAHPKGSQAARAARDPLPETSDPRNASIDFAGFVENSGQWQEEVLFYARHRGLDATLTDDAVTLTSNPSRLGPDTAPGAPLIFHSRGAPTAYAARTGGRRATTSSEPAHREAARAASIVCSSRAAPRGSTFCCAPPRTRSSTTSSSNPVRTWTPSRSRWRARAVSSS